MNRREIYIFTHYTDIAEARKSDMRRMQAEAVRNILGGLVERSRHVFRRLSLGNRAPGMDRA